MAGLLSPAAALMDPVAEELRLWASDPFEFQRNNCGLAIVAYVERVTGGKLIPAPKFDGEIGAGTMLARRGGFEGYCTWAMGRLGCEPTEQPSRGDVALVDLPGGGLTACLCVSPGNWAARGTDGVVIQPGMAVLAWRVRCPRH